MPIQKDTLFAQRRRDAETRILYSLILYLSVPWVLLRLALRGLRRPAYRRRWGERLGRVASFPQGPFGVWVHAVSVGEVQAAVPLVRRLQGRYPGVRILVTTMTPTGSDRVGALLDGSVAHFYAPYDLPGAVVRFLARTRPGLAVFMDSELWPNIYAQCRRRGVPVVVANARLSQRSARRYRWAVPLVRAMLGDVSAVAAQTRDDAERLIGLGAVAHRVQVTGSLKFDIEPPAGVRAQARDLRRRWGRHRKVWIAASTHEGEEAQVLAALATVRRRVPDSLLVLVPRHPERFARAAALARRQGLGVVLRTDTRGDHRGAQVYLGDTMGELSLLYAAADVAFVGGSLVPAGGHNMIEPAALGLPVVYGPHAFNFARIGQLLTGRGGARQVADWRALAETVAELLDAPDLRQRMGAQGRRVVEENRGALDRLMTLLEPYMARD